MSNKINKINSVENKLSTNTHPNTNANNNANNNSNNNANANNNVNNNINNNVKDKDNQVQTPNNLANAIKNQDKLEIETETKNVALSGKDAENLLNMQVMSKPNNTNLVKKNTKKNNLNNPNLNTQNIKRNANQILTQKQSGEITTNNDGINASTNNTEETANSNLESNFENTQNQTSKEIMINLNKLTMNLLNHQIVLKLFHFQTELYGAHKASDAYLEKYASTMDKFLEIAQGIYGKITLKKYTLTGSSHTDTNIIKHLDGMITLLRNKINDVLADYTDLISIRDDLIADAEQLKYLLTFK
jgi:hypothetical protein